MSKAPEDARAALAVAGAAVAAAAAGGAVKNLSKVDAPVGAMLKLDAEMNMVTMRKPLGLQRKQIDSQKGLSGLCFTAHEPLRRTASRGWITGRLHTAACSINSL